MTPGDPTFNAMRSAGGFADYSPALENRRRVVIREVYAHVIDGAFVPSASSKTLTVVEPATGESLAEVASGNAADVDLAVRAARRAFDRLWNDTDPLERGRHLFRLSQVIRRRCREFSVLGAIESGRPVRWLRETDGPAAVAQIFHFAGWADKLEWAVGGGVRPVPLGVVGVILPPGAGVAALARSVAAALAAGNTVVVKPSQRASLSALMFAHICREARLPPGVVNVVTGGDDTGAALAAHSALGALEFTGSAEAGKAVAQSTAKAGTRLLLELEGNSAQLIFDDAPLDQAIDAVVRGIWQHRSEPWDVASRVLVEESIAEEVVDRLARRLQQVRVGDPLDNNTDVGPLDSAEQVGRTEALVAAARQDGAEVVRWAKRPPERGWFVKPTLLHRVELPHRSLAEVTRGPVLSVLTFRTHDEAVAIANQVASGRSAGVWTTDAARSQWVADQLHAGFVWVNSYDLVDPASPTWGLARSLGGDRGGRFGVGAYLDLSADRGRCEGASAIDGSRPRHGDGGETP